MSPKSMFLMSTGNLLFHLVAPNLRDLNQFPNVSGGLFMTFQCKLAFRTATCDVIYALKSK